MANAIYPGIAGAPGYADPSAASSSNGTPPSPPPSDSGGGQSDSGGNIPPTDTSADTGASGLISLDGSNGGINVDVVDTDGDDHGLVDVHSDAPGGLIGDSLDGTHVDVITPNNLVDAQVPGVLDATVGDGTAAGLIGGIVDGDGIGDLGGLVDTLQGVEIDALQDGNLLDVHAPNLADITVGSGEVGGILDLVGDAASGVAGGDGITIEALNGENIAEVHASDVADVTVGGASELGGLLGTLDDAVGGAADAGGNGDGISVEVLNGEYAAEAHVPGALDATVGGAELGNLTGGLELGGIDLPLGGGDLLGDVLQIGSGADLAGLDIGHTLDSITG